jgi:hypothetical protein
VRKTEKTTKRTHTEQIVRLPPQTWHHVLAMLMLRYRLTTAASCREAERPKGVARVSLFNFRPASGFLHDLFPIRIHVYSLCFAASSLDLGVDQVNYALC